MEYLGSGFEFRFYPCLPSLEHEKVNFSWSRVWVRGGLPSPQFLEMKKLTSHGELTVGKRLHCILEGYVQEVIRANCHCGCLRLWRLMSIHKQGSPPPPTPLR